MKPDGKHKKITYYGKPATKQEMREEAAIWRLSRRKAHLTEARTKLILTGLKEHPDVKKVIALLEIERKKLDSINPLEL